MCCVVFSEMGPDVMAGSALGIRRRRGAIKHLKIHEIKGHKFIAKFFRCACPPPTPLPLLIE